MEILTCNIQFELAKEAFSQARILNILIWVAISNCQEQISFVAQQTDSDNNNELQFAKFRGKKHSQAKARTAASFEKPTGILERNIGRSIEIVQQGKFMNVKGGLPIQKKVNGQIINYGGLGISGGTPEQDLIIAYRTLGSVGYLVDKTWLN